MKCSKNDDFKYRFRANDRIKPIFNLKLYWGKKKLEMPQSLKDMMDMDWIPNYLLGLFNDYRIHTVSMLEIPDEELWKMDSDIKYVVGVLKRTERGNGYQQFILDNKDYFERMPMDAYEVIKVCAGIKGIDKYLDWKEENGEERADMCRAIYEIKRDARREGKREGKREGIQCGRQNDILELLKEYGEVPEEIRKLIMKEKNMENLCRWLKLAAKAETIEEFCMAM